MQRPRTHVLVTGHPLVAVPMIALHAIAGVAYTLSEGFDWFSVYAIFVAGLAYNHHQEAAKYRAWRREWDSMDPDFVAPRGITRRVTNIATLIVVAAVTLWMIATYDDPGSAAHLIGPLLLIGLPALWLARAVIRRKRRTASSQTWIVTQATTRALPAPSVADAYARLPDYCRPLFATEAAQKEQS